MDKEKLIGKPKGDRVIWGIVIILAVFSIFVVYSTGSKLGDPLHRESLWFLMRKHVFYFILGFIVLYTVSNINFRWIGRLSRIGLLAGFLLVILTFILGEEAGDAKRGFTAFGISFQTIQLAEVLFVIYFTQWVARIKNEINNIRKVFFPLILYMGVTCALIASQKTSGSIIIGATYLVVLFVSQLKKRYFFAMFGSIFLTVSIFLMIVLKSDTTIFRLDTAKARVEAYLGKTDIHRETIITEAAISRGGILPVPGGSVLMGSVQESSTDYVYAFLIEEYGILAGIIVILLYLALFYRIRRAAINVQSTFGGYLAIGLGVFITFQAFTHILVCIGYFPATGETLPLISRGGMSILLMFFCIGVLLNISQEGEDERKLKIEIEN
ncbi:MAG: FtsW/RodA/SpoVE family cell cycle protein [Bacteroidales bacterium]|nr:FtsW/RodA/SpoVE family cell cycle protein [Bacteroidales bacterium]